MTTDLKYSATNFWAWAGLSIFVTAITFINTTIYMGFASFAYSLMVGGLLFKKKKFLHMLLMNAAIGIDILLVLVLEIQRGAIGTAVAMSLNIPQQLHILFSVLAFTLYFPILFMGWRLHRNSSPSSFTRKWHIQTGILAFIFRTFGFILMYSMVSQVMR